MTKMADILHIHFQLIKTLAVENYTFHFKCVTFKYILLRDIFNRSSKAVHI